MEWFTSAQFSKSLQCLGLQAREYFFRIGQPTLSWKHGSDLGKPGFASRGLFSTEEKTQQLDTGLGLRGKYGSGGGGGTR